jgi:hypothetical protein
MPYRSPYNRGDRDRDGHRDGDFDHDFRHIHPGWPALYNSYLYTPYFLGSDYLDYPEDEDNGPPVAQGDLSPGYDSQPPDQGQPDLPPWPSDNPPPPAAPLNIKPLAQETAEPVTLVFNDGRPSEQIHNYLLTPATLFIFDKQRREIPIGKLDLVATAKANRDAGVDFTLPGPSR